MHRISVFDSPLVRQLAIASVVALAGVLAFAAPVVPITSMWSLSLSFAVIGVATIFAVLVVTRYRSSVKLATVIPAIDFIGIALLRHGTGDGSSLFTSLVVLPVIWFAAREAVRHIVYALLGIVLVILAPLALEPSATMQASEFVRLLVTLIVYAMAGVVIHALARQARLRLNDARAREHGVREELDRAAAVQRSLLPDGMSPLDDGIDIAGACLPAKAVGGDFFDWYATETGMALTLGDVMGKGVGAGMLAAAVRASLRSAHSVDDPAEALRRAADGLTVEAHEADVTFTTLFHARLSPDGTLKWADAGHGLTVIARCDGRIERLNSTDLPLGLIPGSDWHSATTRLEPEDILVSISDGVLDLFSGTLETMNDIGRLARRRMNPAAIVEELSQRSAQVPHDDDVTIIAIARSGARTEAHASLSRG